MAKKNHTKNVNDGTGNGNGKAQTFAFAAPNAKSVELAGDFTQWEQKPIKLRKRPRGVWQTTVELQPGMHRYRFLVDGQWQDDPGCLLHEPNPYGGQDAVRQVA